MGWFTKKDTETGVEKMPELPELPDSAHTDFILPPSQNPPPTHQILSLSKESKITQPLLMLPEKVTKDYSDVSYSLQNNEPKPGMQKSRFGQPEFSSPPPAPPSYQVPVPTPSYTPPPPAPPSYPSPKFKESSYAPTSFPKEAPATPQIKSFPKKDESVFIKLDKFQNTMEAFRDISQKIKEIEDLLLKTKEIKSREEKELEDWEREIDAIKLKIETIGREISGTEA